MNKKENLKVAVIESCVNGTMTIKVAAKRLDFSEYYVKELKARYKKFDDSSMMHGNCGKQPKHSISADIKSKIWEIWNTPKLEECNITHFQKILAEDYGIKISYSPLYRFLKSKGAKIHRKHKKSKNHTRRLERPFSRKLLQVDGTPHRFFYGNNKEYCIHGFIDDATHQITGLYMCGNECMHGYLKITRQTSKNFGVHLALYANGSSIFFQKDNTLTLEEQLDITTASSGKNAINIFPPFLVTLTASLIALFISFSSYR